MKRVYDDWIVGYLGRDEKAHALCWREFEEEEKKTDRDVNAGEVLRSLRRHGIKPIGESKEESQEMKVIESQVQGLADDRLKTKEYYTEVQRISMQLRLIQ